MTVHGFKSYEDTVVFGPFAPGTNALVGLNGTGKSNFYSAISFVLLDEYAHIRVSDRKALLHEGQGRNAMTAFVEIVFDNTSRVFPSDNDEVSIRRSIGLKKDEYFVDRKNSTRQDVRNLLERCGFSPSSGYYIVRQGKVNALAMMKDADRLDLLMEIAGTKFYDSQREESQKMIEESEGRTKKIKDSIDYIQERLRQLDDEKKELEEFEKLDKERKAVEYLIENHELMKTLSDLELKEEEKDEANRVAEELRNESAEIKKEIRTLQSEMNDLRDSEKGMMHERSQIEKKRESSIKLRTSAEYRIRDLESKIQNADSLKTELEANIEKFSREIESGENELESVNQQYYDVTKEKAVTDGELDALKEMIGGQIVDPKGIEDELAKAQQILDNLSQEKARTEAEIQSDRENMSTVENDKAEVVALLRNRHSERDALKREQNEMMNRWKEMWRKEAHLERAIRKVGGHMEKTRAKIENTMPKAVAMGLKTVQAMNIDGVYGCIFDLVSCDEEFDAAVSRVSKGKLFNLVVDKADTAEKIINQLHKTKGGRLSLMALDLMDETDDGLPKGVTSLISHLRFDEKVAPAIQRIFGRVAIADTLDEADTISHEHKINVVTKDGDFVDRNGPMSGGSRSTSRSIMALQSILTKYEEKEREMRRELEELRVEIRKMDNDIKSIAEKIAKFDSETLKLEAEKSDLVAKARSMLDDIDTKAELAEKQRRRVETAERHVMAITTRLNSVRDFNSQAGEGTIEKMKQLTQKQEQLAKESAKLVALRSELEARINRLVPKRKRAMDDIAKLETETILRNLQNAKDDLETAEKNLADTQERIDILQADLDGVATEINNRESLLQSKQNDEDRKQNAITRQKAVIEGIVARISVLRQREQEYRKQLKDIGTLPDAEIERRKAEIDESGIGVRELRRQLADINEENDEISAALVLENFIEATSENIGEIDINSLKDQFIDDFQQAINRELRVESCTNIVKFLLNFLFILEPSLDTKRKMFERCQYFILYLSRCLTELYQIPQQASTKSDVSSFTKSVDLLKQSLDNLLKTRVKPVGWTPLLPKQLNENVLPIINFSNLLQNSLDLVERANKYISKYTDSSSNVFIVSLKNLLPSPVDPRLTFADDKILQQHPKMKRFNIIRGLAQVNQTLDFLAEKGLQLRDTDQIGVLHAVDFSHVFAQIREDPWFKVDYHRVDGQETAASLSNDIFILFS